MENKKDYIYKGVEKINTFKESEEKIPKKEDIFVSVEELNKMKAEAEEIIRKAKESYGQYAVVEPERHGTLLNRNNGSIVKSIEVPIFINGDQNLLPAYQTDGASGMDVRANIPEAITLKPLERKLIPTGIFVELPKGYEFQLRPRSGLALKKGLTLLNCLGTIDDDYRGEIGAIIVNLSNEDATIEPLERIGQLVIVKVDKFHWAQKESSDDFSQTNRKGGYGSTGSM